MIASTNSTATLTWDYPETIYDPITGFLVSVIIITYNCKDINFLSVDPVDSEIDVILLCLT